MSYRWAALALVLALLALTPEQAAGQQQSRGRKPAAAMGSSYPNPFNPEAFIPFSIGDESCSDGAAVHRVTVRIYNVLAQPVAIPVLFGSTQTGTTSSGAAGQAVKDVLLACGSYVAWWDGKYMGTGREVSSGVYLWELIVDGQRVGVRKMFAAK